jgi:hypothetical protein
VLRAEEEGRESRNSEKNGDDNRNGKEGTLKASPGIASTHAVAAESGAKPGLRALEEDSDNKEYGKPELYVGDKISHKPTGKKDIIIWLLLPASTPFDSSALIQ